MLLSLDMLLVLFDCCNYVLRIFFSMQLLKKNQANQLICLVSQVIYVVMTVIMHVTAGEFLMGTTSEFAASIFVMTNQRFLDFFVPVCFKYAHLKPFRAW